MRAPRCTAGAQPLGALILSAAALLTGVLVGAES